MLQFIPAAALYKMAARGVHLVEARIEMHVNNEA
jgi:hypothetical protein